MAYSSFGNLSQLSKGTNSGSESFLVKDELTSPAQKYNKTPAQVALRWAIQRGTIVMPKTDKESRLEENIDVFDFQLTEQEMKRITSLNKNERYLDPAVFTDSAELNCFTPIYE